jgi:hypothetical protein
MFALRYWQLLRFQQRPIATQRPEYLPLSRYIAGKKYSTEETTNIQRGPTDVSASFGLSLQPRERSGVKYTQGPKY